MAVGVWNYTANGYTQMAGGGDGTQYYQTRIAWIINHQVNGATAYSNITVVEQVRSVSSGYAPYGFNQTTTINGVGLVAQTYDLRQTNTWFEWGRRTFDVQHNADGTMGLTLSASFTTTATSTYSLKSGNVSAWVTLDTIPRASQPSLSKSDFNIGDKITINTNRASGSFTHTIRLVFGNYSKTLATGVTTDFLWDTSVDAPSMFAQIPNDPSGHGAIYLDTFSGGTFIDTRWTQFIARVTNSNPNFSGFTYSDTNNTTIALTGDNQTLINGYSNVRTVADMAIAKNSASISKYVTEIGNKISQTTDLNTRTMVVNNVNSNVIRVLAVDSRGNQTERSITVPWKDYSPVLVQNFIAERDNKIDNATQFNITGIYKDVNLGKVENTITSIQYRFKQTNQDETQWSNWISIVPTLNSGNFSFNGYVNGDLGANGFDQNKSFNIEIIVKDKLSTDYIDIARNFILGSGIPGEYLEKFPNGKYGLGIGCRPSGPGFYDNGKRVGQGEILVGDLYFTEKVGDPAANLGYGSWLPYSTGRAIVGMGSNGTTNYTVIGGEAGAESVVLQQYQMPSHNHDVYPGMRFGLWQWGQGVDRFQLTTTSSGTGYPIGMPATNGGDGAHENRMPFKVCYIWKRIL